MFKILFVEAGLLIKDAAGRIGRCVKFPEQFGQTWLNTSVAKVEQNMHSKEQIMASDDSGVKSLSQHSQLGFNASIAILIKY